MQNMNVDIEREIIKNYVKKNKQERIIWELNTLRKRNKVVFEHFSGVNVFQEKYLQSINFMNIDELEKYLFKLGGTNQIYYISENYIGNLSLKQAVQWASEGGICIIYCGKGIGYYQGEWESGKFPRYLLLKDK